MKLRIAGQIAFSNAIIVVMLIAVAIGIGIVNSQGRQATSEATEIGIVVGTDVPALIKSVESSRYNIVQVQQWLTDISATRGLDGLNDGFDKAEAAANGLKKDLDTAKQLAGKLGQDGLFTALEQVEATFPAYYAAGRKMAQGYIDGGPEIGNRMMADFDEAAADMSDALGNVAAYAESYSRATEAKLVDKLKSLEESVQSVFWLTTIVTIAAIIVCALIAWVMHRRIALPVANSVKVLGKLADGDFNVTIDRSTRTDEIGDLDRVMEVFRETGRHNLRMREQQENERLQAEKRRQQSLLNMAEKVESETNRVVETISRQTSELADAAERMSGSANLVQGNAQTVAAASAQALATVEAVAGAGEELNASLGEINGQIVRANKVSEDAVGVSKTTEQTVSQLADSVRGIGEVVELISGIAEQTNLLALNATIEAARAGDAGKGFAVVAQEVKNLATQTSRSTGEITRQISEIQAVTDAAVNAVALIVDKIHEMDEVSTAIAAAVEEQSAATAEIARNVHETADASREVSARITEVSDEASGTGRMASEVGALSAQVAVAVKDLRTVLVEAVRTSTIDVDRRHSQRRPVDVTVNCRYNGKSCAAVIQNISDSGALIIPEIGMVQGSKADLELLAGKPSVRSVVRSVSDGKVSVEFENVKLTEADINALSMVRMAAQ